MTSTKTPKTPKQPKALTAAEEAVLAQRRAEFVNVFMLAIESGGGRECRRILGEYFDRIAEQIRSAVA